MKCPNCGQENREVARFCQHCGAVLDEVRPSDNVPEAPAVDQVATAAVQEAPAVDEGAEGMEETLPLPEEPAAKPLEPEPTEEEPIPKPVESKPAGEPIERDQAESELARELVFEPLAGEPAGEQVESEPVESKPGPEPTESEPVAGAVESEFPAEAVEGEPLRELVFEPLAGEPAGEQVESEPVENELAAEPVESEPVGSTPPEPGTPSASQARAPEEAEMEQPLDSAEDQEELLPVEPETEALPAPEAEKVPAEALLWREPSASLAPLEPGTIVSGRYRVIEVDLAEADENRYQVRDLQRCPQCGYDQNSPDEAFCVSCGAMLDQKPLATMLERWAAAAEEPVDVEFEDHFVAGERAYWVWREGIETGPLEEEGPLRLQIGYRSDTGRARELDEDSLFIANMSSTYEAVEQILALFVVADGMGGHEGGEVASKLAIRTLAELLMHTVFIPELSGRSLLPEQLLNWMRKATEAANDRVYMERRERRTDMGTTLTAALVKGADLYLAHVGDSRAYRWNERGLEQLTTDHSIIASMVASGNARPEEIYTHPQRSVIYRAIGDQPQVQVDTQAVSLFAGDRILICSDGLWEMVREDGIEEVMLRETDPQRACELLVEQANAAGGLDNISVIVVQF